MRARGYKVRNRRTGEYMGAGCRFSKHGKIWATIGHLKLALYSRPNLARMEQLELVILEEAGRHPLGSIYD